MRFKFLCHWRWKNCSPTNLAMVKKATQRIWHQVTECVFAMTYWLQFIVFVFVLPSASHPGPGVRNRRYQRQVNQQASFKSKIDQICSNQQEAFKSWLEAQKAQAGNPFEQVQQIDLTQVFTISPNTVHVCISVLDWQWCNVYAWEYKCALYMK